VLWRKSSSTSAGDARGGYLELTDAGCALFGQACAAHVSRVQTWFLGRFADAEQRVLGEFWTRFEEPSSNP